MAPLPQAHQSSVCGPLVRPFSCLAPGHITGARFINSEISPTSPSSLPPPHSAKKYLCQLVFGHLRCHVKEAKLIFIMKICEKEGGVAVGTQAYGKERSDLAGDGSGKWNRGGKGGSESVAKGYKLEPHQSSSRNLNWNFFSLPPKGLDST